MESSATYTLKNNPELFKYKVGDTVYYIYDTTNASFVFSGVVIYGEIFDDNMYARYGVNDTMCSETELFSDYLSALAVLLSKRKTDYNDKFKMLFDEMRERNQTLAKLIYNYTTVIDIPEKNVSVCDAVAGDGLVKHNITTFLIDRLHIRYSTSDDEYKFSYGVVNSKDYIDVEYSCLENSFISVNEILEDYLNEILNKK
jgi:hypothetical protein